MRRLLLGTVALQFLGLSSGFLTSTPALARIGQCSTAMAVCPRVTPSMSSVLDPMQLIQDKAKQECPLRPYRSEDQNGGLSIATFALG